MFATCRQLVSNSQILIAGRNVTARFSLLSVVSDPWTGIISFMKTVYDEDFDRTVSLTNGPEQPYQVFPNLHGDDRGWFQEVMKGEEMGQWVQANRSVSKPGVVRGCHAQRGKNCQAKLVEAVNETVYDFITDCRPMSKTFGRTKIYCLDPERQNKLYVPRGFLHAFAVPHGAKGLAYFNYWCSAPYDRKSEVCVRPEDIVPKAVEDLVSEMEKGRFRDYGGFLPLVADLGKGWTFSEKDRAGTPFDAFAKQALAEMSGSMRPWYEG